MIEHEEGYDKNSFTFKRRPMKLMFKQTFNNAIEAISFEKKIKKWSAKKKQALIDGNFDMMKILSECRNTSHSKYKPENK